MKKVMLVVILILVVAILGVFIVKADGIEGGEIQYEFNPTFI